MCVKSNCILEQNQGQTDLSIAHLKIELHLFGFPTFDMKTINAEVSCGSCWTWDTINQSVMDKGEFKG